MVGIAPKVLLPGMGGEGWWNDWDQAEELFSPAADLNRPGDLHAQRSTRNAIRMEAMFSPSNLGTMTMMSPP
jgi:hypothetical protein